MMPEAPSHYRVMRTPRTVEIDITNRCNLRCAYCYFFSGPAETDRELPTGEWLEFFEELGECAVMDVMLAGGEPLLRQDLPRLLDGIVRNRMRYSLLSNGTLITDELAALLKQSGRCNQVQISIDGSGPAIHDKSRGAGTFEKALAGLERLRRHQMPVAVRVTVNRYNIDDLEQIAALLLDDVGLPSFSTNSAGYLGLCRQYARDVQLTVAERSRAMQTLLDLSQRYEGRITASAGPLAEARIWMRMERARRIGESGWQNAGHLRSCGGVLTKMAVLADGTLTPCAQMSHVPLGRINRDRLRDVWQTHPELITLRQRVEIPLESFEFCRGCEYIPYCGGNCPALAYNLTGQNNHPSPDACVRQFLQDGGELPNDDC